MEAHFKDLLITDDPSRVDLDKLCGLLGETYWATERPRALIEKSLQHSICVSVLHGDEQVGFARVVTDQAVFASIADVIVDEAWRNHGIGKAMIQFIQDHPDVPATKQLLRTRDAHGLYEQFGFTRDECMLK